MYDNKLYDNLKTLSLLILALSLVMISYGCYLIRRAQQSESWPTTAGKITRSEMIISDVDNDIAKFNIAYEFVVNEIRYTSDVYRFGANGQASSVSRSGDRTWHSGPFDIANQVLVFDETLTGHRSYR